MSEILLIIVSVNKLLKLYSRKRGEQMKLKVSYKHLKSSPAIQKTIENKIDHLRNYFHGDLNINWVCSVEDGVQKSEVHIHVPYNDFYAEAISPNIFNTIDDVIQKLDLQLEQEDKQWKEILHSKRHLKNTINKSKEKAEGL